MSQRLLSQSLSDVLGKLVLEESPVYCSPSLGVIAVDEEDQIVFANPCAADFTQLYPWSLIGRNVHDFVKQAAQDSPLALPHKTTYRRSGCITAMVKVIGTESNETHNLFALASPVLDKNKKCCGSLLFLCKLPDSPLVRELFDQLFELDNLIDELHQADPGLLRIGNKSSVASQVHLAQIAMSLETVDSNIQKLIKFFPRKSQFRS